MKKIFCWVLFCCGVLILPAQDLKSLFVAMPDSLSPLLTKVNREDFGDFLDSNMKAQVKNRFGKTSEMLKLTADYLQLKLTEVSMVEMKLFPVNDSVNVICVVQTRQGPAADSKVSFYDTGWKLLPAASYLHLPDEDIFFKSPSDEISRDSLLAVRKLADMYLLKAELSEEEPVILFTYTTPDYLDKNTAGKVKACLRTQSVRQIWKDGHFVE